MGTELTVTLLMVGALCAYTCAFAAMLFRLRKIGYAICGAGWTVNAGLIAINWLVAGQPPLGNMYHVMVFLALTSSGEQS